STHSRLPIYCDLRAVSRPANRADNSLKRQHPSRLFALTVQTIEKWTETALQAGINLHHGDLFPQFLDACDAKFGDAARHDAAEMSEVRSDVQRKAVKRHPTLHPH